MKLEGLERCLLLKMVSKLTFKVDVTRWTRKSSSAHRHQLSDLVINITWQNSASEGRGRGARAHYARLGTQELARGPTNVLWDGNPITRSFYTRKFPAAACAPSLPLLSSFSAHSSNCIHYLIELIRSHAFVRRITDLGSASRSHLARKRADASKTLRRSDSDGSKSLRSITLLVA